MQDDTNSLLISMLKWCVPGALAPCHGVVNLAAADLGTKSSSKQGSACSQVLCYMYAVGKWTACLEFGPPLGSPIDSSSQHELGLCDMTLGQDVLHFCSLQNSINRVRGQFCLIIFFSHFLILFTFWAFFTNEKYHQILIFLTLRDPLDKIPYENPCSNAKLSYFKNVSCLNPDCFYIPTTHTTWLIR